ncbi:hypothetical protein [Plantactinospora sp. DSM 117369]
MLAGVLGCFAGRFGRVEPRRAAAEFVTGLLAVAGGQEQSCCGVGADAVTLQQLGCVGVDGLGDPLVEVLDLVGELPPL